MLIYWLNQFEPYDKPDGFFNLNIYHVYIVQCLDGTLYTGIAKDVRERIKQHNTGKGARYTRGRGPVKLIYSEVFKTRSEALRREMEIKKWPREKKLRMIEYNSQVCLSPKE